MEKKKGLKCECGGLFEAKIKAIDKIPTEVMTCVKCGRLSFTLEQAKYHTRMKLLQARFAKERKVVRLGNSVGVTLPEGFAHIGQKVQMIPKDEHHLELVIR